MIKLTSYKRKTDVLVYGKNHLKTNMAKSNQQQLQYMGTLFYITILKRSKVKHFCEYSIVSQTRDTSNAAHRLKFEI